MEATWGSMRRMSGHSLASPWCLSLPKGPLGHVYICLASSFKKHICKQSGEVPAWVDSSRGLSWPTLPIRIAFLGSRACQAPLIYQKIGLLDQFPNSKPC